MGYNQRLPSRILELLDPSDEKNGVRLIETRGKMQGTYACLSYCWGGLEQIGQTTRNNLPAQLESIPFKSLPCTVVDAIRLCYKLGFRYLWVDRLCIVQDHEADWLKEASKMCDIYSRSALTISVPICTESSQSFLEERRRGFQEQTQFSTITHTDQESRYKCEFWLTSSKLTREDGPWFLENDWILFCDGHSKRGNRWLERGWTFQEWMLSPRVLHIDSITLWDCFDGYANELNRRRMNNSCLMRDPRGFGEGISWDSIVAEYSKRHITRNEDRLPALAGLAARYAQVTGRTYLCGVWREDLPRSLLWERKESISLRNASRETPSWTWAAFDGAVWYDPFNEARRFTARAFISSTFCQYNTPESFSAVKKAWIDIDSRVILVTDQKAEGEWMEIKAGSERWHLLTDLEDGLPHDLLAQGNIYLLVVGAGRWNGETRCGALVLHGCGWDDGRRCFRRLGIAHRRSRTDEVRPREFGASWETQTIRLV